MINRRREGLSNESGTDIRTPDIFHVGHVRLLRRLKALGDRFIVGLSTDEFNALKGKSAIMRFEDRREVLEAVDAADLVIPECPNQKIDDVREHNVDIFGIGDDWEEKFDFLKPHCEVVYLSRTMHFIVFDKSTDISSPSKISSRCAIRSRS